MIKEVNNMLRMPDVATYLGFHPDSKGFIKSPFHDEKTASCKLYKELGRGYYDFSAGEGGDCIRFVARTQGMDNWKASRLMIEAFNLPIDMKSTHLTRKRVQQLKRDREQKETAKKVEKSRWVNRVDELKAKIEMYENLLQSEHIPVFSSVWCWCVDLRMKSIVELNEICGLETMSADLKLPIRQELKTRKTG
ncbi:CHC2 zinc finger domain-containing protein [Blautia massiliensis (ex Durand et al. 2017)]|uniref:CHC2 zinc finger domain-containing protein n=1 Tax=Blautia massiliensis (ex Durand et al. 2017) TaxID=1737424 RepID=UPI00189A8D62|nr:CHC2 zinc finger domain-containing protein [Blautia massiliensis (ex Durand et al. 2017)]